MTRLILAIFLALLTPGCKTTQPVPEPTTIQVPRSTAIRITFPQAPSPEAVRALYVAGATQLSEKAWTMSSFSRRNPNDLTAVTLALRERATLTGL